MDALERCRGARRVDLDSEAYRLEQQRKFEAVTDQNNLLLIETILAIFSGLQTVAIGMMFFIMKDIRDRVARLESISMGHKQ